MLNIAVAENASFSHGKSGGEKSFIDKPVGILEQEFLEARNSHLCIREFEGGDFHVFARPDFGANVKWYVSIDKSDGRHFFKCVASKWASVFDIALAAEDQICGR